MINSASFLRGLPPPIARAPLFYQDVRNRTTGLRVRKLLWTQYGPELSFRIFWRLGRPHSQDAPLRVVHRRAAGIPQSPGRLHPLEECPDRRSRFAFYRAGLDSSLIRPIVGGTIGHR